MNLSDFTKVVFSKGMAVFAVVLFLLNLLSFKYIGGFKSFWLMGVIEITALVSYVIAQNVSKHQDNIWFRDK